MVAAFLHQLEYLTGGRFAKSLSGLYAQRVAHIDATAEYLVAYDGFAGHRLSRQGGSIEYRLAFGHNSVDGHLLASPHHNLRADAHLLRAHLLDVSLALHIGIVGTYVHQRQDVAPALAYSMPLEEFAHLEEQHHGYRLVVVARTAHECKGKGSDGSYGHEEILIEHLAVQYSFGSLAQYVVAYYQIYHEEGGKATPSLYLHKLQYHYGDCRHRYAREHHLVQCPLGAVSV